MTSVRLIIRRHHLACIIITCIFWCLASPTQADTNTFSPQQKMAIVLEGINKSQAEVAALCKKHDITVDTFRQWEQTLRGSADCVFGSGRATANCEPDTILVSGGLSGVAALPVSNNRKTGWFKNLAVTGAFAYAHRTERNGYGGGRHIKSWTPMGAVTMTTTRGREALSLSLIGTLDESRDSYDGWSGAGTWRSQFESSFYYADVRYTRAVSNRLSLFAGYTAAYTDWDYADVPVTVPWYFRSGGWSVMHGPIVGANVDWPIPNVPVFVYGSLAFSPVIVAHRETTINNNGLKERYSGCGLGVYANPEMGLRWDVHENASFHAGWFWFLGADYTDGPAEIVHGPKVGFTWRF